MTKTTRRNFLTAAALGGAAFAMPAHASANEKEQIRARYELLDKALTQPILKRQFFDSPIRIKSLELLEYNGAYLCRVRSEDGAEGLSVAHPSMPSFYPIFLRHLRPFFIGQDCRELDLILERVFVFHSNFRLNGMAIGLPLATIEFAIFDMLGKIADKPAAELFGEIRNTEIPLYYATELRELPLEEHFARIKAELAPFDINALKIRVGYQVTGTKDIHYAGIPGKSEKLVPMVREHYGDDFILYADANGYYDVNGAIQMGKLLEEYKYGYFEEPVLYWHFEETKAVADALDIPIAHGEQDQSLYNFRWLLANDGIDIVEPDCYYIGGFVRAMRVALMAHAMGKPCLTHMSGGGLGYFYNAIFVSALPNPFETHEFKSFNTHIPFESPGVEQKLVDGKMKAPVAPGLGAIIDPEFVAKHKPVTR